MELRILGHLEAWDADAPLGLGPHKQQALLARLVLDAGRVVAVDRLVDDLWGAAVPDSAVKMVQIYVSQLRKVLPPGTLVTRRPGYVADLSGHTLDLDNFGELRRRGAEALARGDVQEASDRLHAALALWRGEPLAEFEEPFALLERAALEATRLACFEDRVEADLALGRHAEIAGELEALVARHPGRERLCRLAMLALYRCGRQGDALAAYDLFRRSLDEELGIAPSAELRDLQVRILRQDPALAGESHATRETVGAGPPPPVGRERELTTLREALADAVAGVRRVAFVTGEAGAGKTTLVETLLADPPPRALVATGQCVEHHGPGEAYMPVLDALGRLARGPAARDVAELLEQQAPTWLMQMPALAADADRALLETRVLGATPDRRMREMLDFLDALAARDPVVLVLEDLHWSDLATIDLLAALARRQDDAALFVIATYRRAEARAAGHPLDRIARELHLRGLATELPLEPLAEQAIARYLAERGLRDVTATVIAALQSRTRGNPLFLEKIVDEAGGRMDALLGRLPDSLRDLVESQLLDLGEDEARVLEAAAVAGVEAASAAVAWACEIDPEEAEELLAGLAARGAFVEAAGEERWPDGTVTARFRFLHDAYQEIVYDRLQPARRARLHRRIGTRLEQAHGASAPEIAAQLASHFIQGRDPVRGIRHLQLAAEQAFHRAAPRDALAHVRLGLGVAGSLPDGLRMRVELALRNIQGPSLVATHGWGHEEAERSFLRLRELCDEIGDPEDRQWALFKLAIFYEVRGQFVRSEALLAETLSHPERAANVEVRVDSHELMACSLFHQSAFTRSVEHAERLLDLWDGRYCNPLTAANGDNPAVAAHLWAALSLWFLGKVDQARNRALEGVAMAQHPLRVPGQATAFAQAALLASLRREPRWTLELAEQAIEVSTAGGFPYRVAMGQILRGWALVHIDGTDEGMQDIHDGLALYAATGVRMDDLCFVGLHADACLRAGRLEEGLAAVEEARPLLRTDRTFFYVPELHRLEGELRARAGADGVLACLDRAAAAARVRYSPSLLLRVETSRARVLAAAGRGDEAAQPLATARAALSEGVGTPDLRDADELLAALPR